MRTGSLCFSHISTVAQRRVQRETGIAILHINLEFDLCSGLPCSPSHLFSFSIQNQYRFQRSKIASLESPLTFLHSSFWAVLSFLRLTHRQGRICFLLWELLISFYHFHLRDVGSSCLCVQIVSHWEVWREGRRVHMLAQILCIRSTCQQH